MKYKINDIKPSCVGYNIVVDLAYDRIASLEEKYEYIKEKYEVSDIRIECTESYDKWKEQSFDLILHEVESCSKSNEYLDVEEIYNEYLEALKDGDEENIKDIESYLESIENGDILLNIGENNKIEDFNYDGSFSDYLHQLVMELFDYISKSQIEEIIEEISLDYELTNDVEYIILDLKDIHDEGVKSESEIKDYIIRNYTKEEED